MTTPKVETPREFAERLLRDCTSVSFYGYGGAEVERDFDDAAALIEADRLAAVAAALEPFRALARELGQDADFCRRVHMKSADDVTEWGIGADVKSAIAMRLDALLLPPAEKAGPR